jgi:hypothetical protein
VRPTPIPDAELWPGSVRVVLGAPGGDLTGDGSGVDQASAVEVLVDRGQDTGAPRCCIPSSWSPATWRSSPQAATPGSASTARCPSSAWR